jgi:hypothetical protein
MVMGFELAGLFEAQGRLEVITQVTISPFAGEKLYVAEFCPTGNPLIIH